MARPRVYRRQARCPECGSNRIPKDGHSKGHQVYHCGRRYIPAKRPVIAPARQQGARGVQAPGRQLVARGGAGFRGQHSGGDPVAQKGGALRCPGCGAAAAKALPAAVIAGDEMWTYRKARRQAKRPGLWVWPAVG